MLPYDPAIHSSDVYPKEIKHVHTKTCTGIVTAAVFTIAPKWKKPKYLPTHDWINGMWYINSMDFIQQYKGIKYW